MTKIDDFKSFVQTKPELISYVKKGTMTWQKFYELWYLYGPDHEEWNKYKETEAKSIPKVEGFGLPDIFNMLKKIDLEGVRSNINGIQKAIGLIQDITNKGSSPKVDVKEPYNPRPIYQRFED